MSTKQDQAQGTDHPQKNDNDAERDALKAKRAATLAIVVAVLPLLYQVFIQPVVNERTRVRQARWELKRTTSLKALDMIDDALVHSLSKGRELRRFNGHDIRTARNELALCCDNPEIVSMFLELITIGQSANETGVQTSKVNDFLDIIRKELDYGRDLHLDPKKSWVGTMVGQGTNVELLPY